MPVGVEKSQRPQPRDRLLDARVAPRAPRARRARPAPRVRERAQQERQHQLGVELLRVGLELPSSRRCEIRPPDCELVLDQARDPARAQPVRVARVQVVDRVRARRGAPGSAGRCRASCRPGRCSRSRRSRSGVHGLRHLVGRQDRERNRLALRVRRIGHPVVRGPTSRRARRTAAARARRRPARGRCAAAARRSRSRRGCRRVGVRPVLRADVEAREPSAEVVEIPRAVPAPRRSPAPGWRGSRCTGARGPSSRRGAASTVGSVDVDDRPEAAERHRDQGRQTVPRTRLSRMPSPIMFRRSTDAEAGSRRVEDAAADSRCRRRSAARIGRCTAAEHVERVRNTSVTSIGFVVAPQVTSLVLAEDHAGHACEADAAHVQRALGGIVARRPGASRRTSRASSSAEVRIVRDHRRARRAVARRDAPLVAADEALPPLDRAREQRMSAKLLAHPRGRGARATRGASRRARASRLREERTSRVASGIVEAGSIGAMRNTSSRTAWRRRSRGARPPGHEARQVLPCGRCRCRARGTPQMRLADHQRVDGVHARAA